MNNQSQKQTTHSTLSLTTNSTQTQRHFAKAFVRAQTQLHSPALQLQEFTYVWLFHVFRLSSSATFLSAPKVASAVAYRLCSQAGASRHGDQVQIKTSKPLLTPFTGGFIAKKELRKIDLIFGKPPPPALAHSLYCSR